MRGPVLRGTVPLGWLLALLLALLGAARAEAALEGRTLQFFDGDTLKWTRTFAPQLGPLSDPITHGGAVWIGVGPQLYALTPAGTVRARLDLPTDLSALDDSGDVLRATVRWGAVPESFTVQGDRLTGREVFPPSVDPQGGPPNPALSWLLRAATLGADFSPYDPADPQRALAFFGARVQEDPTNPLSWGFESLAALRAHNPALARRAAEQALGRPAPFFVSVQLARIFDAAGRPADADRALLGARSDWAARGYDPALPVSRAALRAYGDPLGYALTLLDAGNARRLDAWMRYLRDTSPRFEGYRDIYLRYAASLDAQERAGEAADWRRFARELDAGSLYNLGENGLSALRDVARWAALALVFSLAAAALTLSARAWGAQGRDLRALGGRYRSWFTHPVSRARRILLSYTGFGERLVLVALFAGLLLTLSAWTWADRTAERARSPVLNFGTLGGAWFYDGLDDLGLDVGPEANLLRGLAAQLDGDPATARDLYATSGPQSPTYACALNNLGVLADTRGDPVSAREDYRLALARDPGLVSAAYNLRLDPSGFEAAFQRLYRMDPRLCYPSLRTVYRAVDGALGGQLGAIAQSPVGYLSGLPTGLPRPLQWLWVLALLGLAAVTFLWLFIPRVPGAGAATRPALFRLLALLLPGTALLDGAWGLVLLLAWSGALVGLVTLSGVLRFPYLLDLRTGAPFVIVLAVLTVAYAVNLLAVLLEEVRFAGRRRRALQTGTAGR